MGRFLLIMCEASVKWLIVDRWRVGSGLLEKIFICSRSMMIMR